MEIIWNNAIGNKQMLNYTTQIYTEKAMTELSDQYQGYYKAYCYWDNEIKQLILKIGEYNNKTREIEIKVYTHKDGWAFEGSLIKLEDSLLFLLEKKAAIQRLFLFSPLEICCPKQTKC